VDRDTLVWHFPHYRHDPGPYSILRQGNWKYLKFWDGPQELYDLKNDPSEAKNVAESQKERVVTMDALLLKQLKAQDAKLPRLNPDHS